MYECSTCGKKMCQVPIGAGDKCAFWIPTTPKPDPWACRLHPKGRCGNVIRINGVPACCDGDSIMTGDYLNGMHDYDTCPYTKTRMKDPPTVRTNLEVAVEAVHNLHINSVAHPQDWEYAKVIMKALGLNPSAPFAGKE